jgi:hypothetical protein
MTGRVFASDATWGRYGAGQDSQVGAEIALVERRRPQMRGNGLGTRAARTLHTILRSCSG